MLEIIPCIFNHRIKFIKPKDIQYVQSDVRGVYVVCADKEYYTELTLAVMEVNRCHRQNLINLNAIDELIPQGNGLAEIKTKSGHSVPVSRHYLKLLKGCWGM